MSEMFDKIYSAPPTLRTIFTPESYIYAKSVTHTSVCSLVRSVFNKFLNLKDFLVSLLIAEMIQRISIVNFEADSFNERILCYFVIMYESAQTYVCRYTNVPNISKSIAENHYRSQSACT